MILFFISIYLYSTLTIKGQNTMLDTVQVHRLQELRRVDQSSAPAGQRTIDIDGR